MSPLHCLRSQLMLLHFGRGGSIFSSTFIPWRRFAEGILMSSVIVPEILTFLDPYYQRQYVGQ